LNELTSEARLSIWKQQPNKTFAIDGKLYKKPERDPNSTEPQKQVRQTKKRKPTEHENDDQVFSQPSVLGATPQQTTNYTQVNSQHAALPNQPYFPSLSYQHFAQFNSQQMPQSSTQFLPQFYNPHSYEL
jgi:hypothetical protein